MRQVLRGATALALCVVCYGLTVPFVMADDEAIARIQSTNAHVLIEQDEIDVNFQVPYAGAAFLGHLHAAPIPLFNPVGAAIGSGIRSSMTEKVSRDTESLRKQLAGFDFRAEFKNLAGPALTSIGALKVSKLEVSNKPYEGLEYLYGWRVGNMDDPATLSELDMAVSRKTAAMGMSDSVTQDSLLLLVVNYHLTSDYRSVAVVGTLTLWKRGRSHAQYVGTYQYLSAPVGSKKGNPAIAAWQAEGAKRLRAVLQQGISEIARMIDLGLKTRAEPDSADLRTGGDFEQMVAYVPVRGGSKETVKFVYLGSIANQILAVDGDRIVYRARNSPYVALNQIVSTSNRLRLP